jgi:hypothetical protein
LEEAIEDEEKSEGISSFKEEEDNRQRSSSFENSKQIQVSTDMNLSKSVNFSSNLEKVFVNKTPTIPTEKEVSPKTAVAPPLTSKSSSASNSPPSIIQEKKNTIVEIKVQKDVKRINSIDEIESPSPVPMSESDLLMEKRKKDIEEKKRLLDLKKKEIEEKRRKQANGDVETSPAVEPLKKIQEPVQTIQQPTQQPAQLPIQPVQPIVEIKEEVEKKHSVHFDPVVTMIQEEEKEEPSPQNGNHFTINEDEKEEKKFEADVKKAVSPKMVQFNPYIKIENDDHGMDTFKIDEIPMRSFNSGKESPKQVSFSPIVEYIETETEIKDDEIANLLSAFPDLPPSPNTHKRKIKLESVSEIQQKAIETTRKVLHSLMNNDHHLTADLTIELDILQKRFENLEHRVASQNVKKPDALFRPLECGTIKEEDNLIKIALVSERLKFREERLKAAEKFFEIEWNFQSESKRLFSKLSEQPISIPETKSQKFDSFYIPSESKGGSTAAQVVDTKQKKKKLPISIHSNEENPKEKTMQSPLPTVTNIDVSGNREMVDPNEFVKRTSLERERDSPDADEYSMDYPPSTDNDTISDDPYKRQRLSEPIPKSPIENKVSSGNHLKLYVDLPEMLSKQKQLTLQKYQCAGCSNVLKDSLFSRPRYCYYSCKYYCSDCHKNDTHFIPANIIHNWDFTLNYVCSSAKSYLVEINILPLICVSAVNPSLFDKVPTLQKARVCVFFV